MLTRYPKVPRCSVVTCKDEGQGQSIEPNEPHCCVGDATGGARFERPLEGGEPCRKRKE